MSLDVKGRSMRIAEEVFSFPFKLKKTFVKFIIQKKRH